MLTLHSYQGGFLLDGGVHYTAALQILLPYPIARLSAFTAQVQPHLPPQDTISATMKLSNGIVGHYNSSFGTTLKAFEFAVACEEGSVTVTHGKVTVRNKSHEVIEVKEFPEDKYGVRQEIEAFAESLKGEREGKI